MNSNSVGNRRGQAQFFFVSSALLVGTLLFAMPLGIYLNNIGEFAIPTADLLLFLLPMFGIGMLIAYVLWRAVPVRWHPGLAAVVCALACLVWLQGNVLVWDYGPLDGRLIQWDDYRVFAYLDSAIWISGIGAAAVLIPRLPPKALLILPAIILFASFSQLAIELYAKLSAGAPSVKNFRVDDSDKFEFSREQNVILIVADEFQSDVFDEVVREPKYGDVFTGFTYFPNAVAGSNFTQLAIPALLSGHLYDNSEPRTEFMARAFLGYSITTLLKSNNFDVGIYPWMGWGNETMYFHEDIASNLVARTDKQSSDRTYSEANAKEVLHMLDLALFRTMPQALKSRIYNEQKWLLLPLALKIVPTSIKQVVSQDNQYETSVFVAEAVARTTESESPATFRYYHIKGAHQPLSVDSNLQFTNQVIPYDRDSYVASVKANIRELGSFLDRLRDLDLFDNSLIVIVGDHGSGNTADVYVRPNGVAPPADEGNHEFQKQKARGVPVVLVKRAGASSDMQYNPAPISLMDIPATILAETGVDAPATGRSVFEIETDERRTRQYAAMDYSANRSEYVGSLTLFEVSGDSWLDESWHRIGVLPPAGDVEANAGE